MAQESEQDAIIRPTFHHFGVLTARLEEMINWYARVIGMRTNFQSTTGEIGFGLAYREYAPC